MMARAAADPGPADTPEQIAAQKAERSRLYRASQTTRNLVAALLATLAVVVVIVVAVPRGDLAPREPIDVAAVAVDVEATYNRPILVPEVPDTWRVNGAGVGAASVPAWAVVYVPDEASFVNVAQGFDADDAWASQRLRGAAPTGTVVIDELTWDVYQIANPSRNSNISYALGIQAGADHVLIYGSATPETTALVAEGLTGQVLELQEADE